MTGGTGRDARTDEHHGCHREKRMVSAHFVCRGSEEGHPLEVRGGHALCNVAAAWQISVHQDLFHLGQKRVEIAKSSGEQTALASWASLVSEKAISSEIHKTMRGKPLVNLD